MLTRRELLLAGLGAAAAGRSALGCPRPTVRRCRPVMSGALWWYDVAESARWGSDGWRDELDRQSRIRFNLLWLCNAPSALRDDNDARNLRALLDLCARRKIRVIMDTGSTGRWYERLDLDGEIDTCSRYIAEIGKRFAGHPAFFAWYVPHEIYMCWGEFGHYIDALYPSLVERCKMAADVPVTLSPFFILDHEGVFGDFRYNEPDEYRDYWTRLIRRSGFDILMMQDSGEHFSYVTNEMRRPFFEAMWAACRGAGAEFWGNVETAEFECASKEEYVKRYGRVHHSTVQNPPWRPVPIDRLRDKLDLASRYCSDIVTWGYREFCRPSLGEAAAKWYEDYRQYLKASDSGSGG